MSQRAQMCSVCGLVFETEEELQRHEAEAHASKETPTDPQRDPA
jgi:rubredoxin